MQEDNLTYLGLTEKEVLIVIGLRLIAMKRGSVKLNYDENGIFQSADGFKHYTLDELSTGLCLTQKKK